ncbi:MAG: hypothetical protein WA177_11810 [Xanthobacteraceae bacterium]
MPAGNKCRGWLNRSLVISIADAVQGKFAPQNQTVPANQRGKFDDEASLKS